MDAKQRAQFINAQSSPSEPAIKICSNCGAEVRGKFCTKCGTKYEAPKPAVKEEPAYNPFAEMKEEPVTNPFAEVKEEQSALAKGLPEWNIEPPQVVVRRKRR